MPDVRDFEPHVALVGAGRDRGGRARARSTCCGPAAGSCSRSATARRPRLLRCSTSLGYAERRHDARSRPAASASSRAAVADDRGGRRRAPRRAARDRSRPTPSTASPRAPYAEEPVATALPRSRAATSAQPTALVAAERRRAASSACPSCAAAPARSRARSCPGRTRSCCRTRRGAIRWLNGASPETIGVRVPDARRARRARCSTRVGAVAATSANLPGGPDPRTLDDVPGASSAPPRPRSSTAASCPGTPSTVLDFTGPEPRVLREGAAPGRRGARGRVALRSARVASVAAIAGRSQHGRRTADPRAAPQRGPRRGRSRDRRRCSAASSSGSAARSS